MQIGVLAERAGTSRSRIRFYEDAGLLTTPLRDESGYRDYPEQTLTVLRFIDRAQSVGFSLNEIAEHLRSPLSLPERKKRLLEVVENKRAEVDTQLLQLQSTRDALSGLVLELNGCIESAEYQSSDDSGVPAAVVPTADTRPTR